MTWLRLLLTVAMIGVVCAGCRTRRPKGGAAGGPGSDTVDITKLEGETPLGERPGEGTPIQGTGLELVYFAFDSFQIASSEITKVERAADFMKSNPNTWVVIEGHCDERGSREYNMSLGEHRALAVRAHLVGLGIDPSRIQTRSYGEERPVAMGHDESAWRENRRAEFVLYR